MEKEVLKQALQDLIAKGLVEEFTVDGEVKYRLTPLGRSISEHMESVPSNRN